MNVAVKTCPQNQWSSDALKASIAHSAMSSAACLGLEPSAIDAGLLEKKIYLDMLEWVIPAGNA